MKRIGLLLSFVLLAFFTNAQEAHYDTIPYALDYHESRLKIFRHEPVVQGNTIFLGNSITEFGDWQKLLDDSTIINRGIAGDNTFGVLARLEDVINRKPGKLFIEIGINDISQNIPIKIIVKNISTIIKSFKANSPATKIYIHSILPTNDSVKNNYPNAYNKNDIVNLVNSQLNNQAKKYNIIYIDIHKMFRDKYGKLNIKYAEADGLHLNDFAYKIWAGLLKKNKYL